MQKKVSIIGSTGSIGRQALEVIGHFSEKFAVAGLAAQKSWQTLRDQLERFHPPEAAIVEREAWSRLVACPGLSALRISSGDEGVARIAGLPENDVVLVAAVGIAGLRPTLAAIEAGHTLALATKEALVAAGSLVMERVRERGVTLIPVDSEHSAIFQCLRAQGREVARILLTSSGGPFRGFTARQLRNVTREMALAHPTWMMGSKITVDSATLMNKGFEVIEAFHLFSVPIEKIEVVIHPQSIIHSLVEFCDGSVLAQLSPPDMRLPIQYALGYPEGMPMRWQKLNLAQIGKLTFEEPDLKNFRCLSLAYDALREGGTLPVALNGANEVAVELFLKGLISFTHIPVIIERTMERHAPVREPGLEDIIEADRQARQEALGVAKKLP
ncbi:MAG: 1-deoxy-D-xylulose-5-phosphate reductoisomerase [Candidatus Eremiobacteraeota bacterium]|nr:1-deoxy-D-xylulose-5-phosphate reductoisomerase [Candidatus Eremiobacteraeota bacterium]